MSAHTNGANGNGARSRAHNSGPSLVLRHGARGDSASFEALFRTYHGALCAFVCTYVRCPWIAEELVDDVFVRVWERRSTWDSCLNKKRYLYTAVRNSALKVLAHERVVRTSHAMVKDEGRSPAMGQPPAPADEEVNAHELEGAFDLASHQLPARCHKAYMLHYDEGLSYREIAEIMGISERTVEPQVAKARKVFRRELTAWLT
jgi:RNA polymerase sigma-70 factor (ECF subfamily)